MFGGAFRSHWLRLFGWVLNFINAHELLQDAVVNANEHISLLRGQPLPFDQVNIGGRCSEPSAERTEVSGKTVPLGCLSVEALWGSSPFPCTPALLKQVINCICVCTYTHPAMSICTVHICVYLSICMCIHVIHTRRHTHTKGKSELSWWFWTIQRSFVPCVMSQRVLIPPWHVSRYPQPGVCVPCEATSGPLSLCALLNMWEVEQSRNFVTFLLEAVNRQLLLEYSTE